MSAIDGPKLHIRLSEQADHAIPVLLPHEKVYAIQVGNRTFGISGASLSSDGPSYFTNYFNQKDNIESTLIIDRDPDTFEKICKHLQGYVILVDSDYEFVHLWSDSYYFGLRKLQKFLSTEDIFASIGGVSFKIDRSLISGSGDYPNYFTISNDSILSDSFQLIEEKKMLRPPPKKPIHAPSRSPQLFADILELLKGNYHILKDDEHRALLMRECKYYRFLQLEQRLVKHKVINNPFSKTQDVVINLHDLQPKGLVKISSSKLIESPLQYARPFISEEPARNLICQIDTNSVASLRSFSQAKLILNQREKIAILQLTDFLCMKFLQVFKDYLRHFITEADATKTIVAASLADCKAVINGIEMKENWVNEFLGGENLVDISAKNWTEDIHEVSAKKRKLSDDSRGDIIELNIIKSLWKILTIEGASKVHGVCIEAVSDHSSFIRNVIDYI